MKNLITCILLGFCIGNFVSDQALTEALPGVQTHNRSLNSVSISKKQTLRPKLMYGPRFPLENVKKWAHKRQLKELEKNKSPIADKNDTILQKVDSSVHRTETPTTEKYDPAMQKSDSRIVGNPLKVQKNVSIDEETALGESFSNFNGGSDSLEHLENGLFSAGNDGDMQKILSELASENSNDSGSRNEEKQEARTNETEHEERSQKRDTREISEKKSKSDQCRKERSPVGYKNVSSNMAVKSNASVKPLENIWFPRYSPWRSNFSSKPLQDKLLTPLDGQTTTLNNISRADNNSFEDGVSFSDRNNSSDGNSTATTEDELNVQISITTLLLVAILLCCITNIIFCCTLCFTID